MYDRITDSQALMTAAIEHRIAADALLAECQSRKRLPVRTVIVEQYATSLRLALESFLACQELISIDRRPALTLHALFLHCERHGLDLPDTADFSTENFEVLLVACDENSNFRNSSRNACYTADLVWPQLYAAHLIEAVQSMIDRNARTHTERATPAAGWRCAFPAGAARAPMRHSRAA